MNRIPVLALCALTLTGACAPRRGPVPVAPADTPPPPITREMRGLWVATVANIDWPSRADLTADQQRLELVDILDRAAATGFNAIVFQIRPAADALYRSPLEPWGLMLTGTQGTDPGYDPLELAVREAHARGLELHAWINPFRAGRTADSAKLAATHVFHERRDLVVVYGTELWLDPGNPAVADRVMQVVRDIAMRYDIDAIHADDYFYPYQQRDSAAKLMDFPDSASYAAYVTAGGTLARDDWRRDNVNRFIERMYREVHALQPSLRVGISPFGIWRPGNPPGVNGLDAFASIYADARKWLHEGWIDYLAPQLYWAIAAPQQSYPALLDWWLGENTLGRNVWPGLGAYRVSNGSATQFTLHEIPEQIRLTRMRPGGTGHILYNTTSTLRRANGELASAVGALYQTGAVVPASPWLDSVPPTPSAIAFDGDRLRITPAIGEEARWWVVQLRRGGVWSTRTYFGDRRTIDIDRQVDRVRVAALDRAGNASALTTIVRR